MKRLGRRSPTIINAAYGVIFMWDGRADSLEEQALGPIQADVEMAMPLEELLKRLKAINEYPPLFEAAFPGKGITAENIGKAIATYERTVISGRAPFDAWIDGDERAISDAAKRGFTLFNTKAECKECHSGWNFTDDSFHDIGLQARTSAAASSCRKFSNPSTHSRRRDCARSPTAHRSCTTARSRHSSRSSSTTAPAGSTVPAGPN